MFGPEVATPQTQTLVDRILGAMESPACINVLSTDKVVAQLFQNYEFTTSFSLRQIGEYLHSYDGREYRLHPDLIMQRVLLFDILCCSDLTIMLGAPPKAVAHAINQSLRRLDKKMAVIDAEQNIEQLEDVIATLTKES